MNAVFEGMATVLAWFYEITRSYGFAIVLLTLSVRLLVTPLTIKGTRSMMAMQKFQPEIKRLQQEHKGDRQQLNDELLKLYREHNINPVGGCLPLLVQLPVFFVLYQVIRGLTRFGDDGTFNPDHVSPDSALFQDLDNLSEMNFLGIDLARSASEVLSESFVAAIPYLAIIAVVVGTSYVTQRQISGRNPDAMINPMQKNLMRFMPLMFGVFAFTFQAALGIYFVTSNLFQVGQQWYISRHLYGVGRGGKGTEGDDAASPSGEGEGAGGDDGAKSGEGSGKSRGASPKPGGESSKTATAAGGGGAAAGSARGGKGSKSASGAKERSGSGDGQRARRRAEPAKPKRTYSSGRVTEAKSRPSQGGSGGKSQSGMGGKRPNPASMRSSGQSGSPPSKKSSSGKGQGKGESSSGGRSKPSGSSSSNGRSANGSDGGQSTGKSPERKPTNGAPSRNPKRRVPFASQADQARRPRDDDAAGDGGNTGGS